MRFTSRLIAIVTGLFIAHLAAAASPGPQRWVSAGGALTEWIVALGGESRLVGVDSTSQHPRSVKSLPGIGYQRQLSAEGILTLRPNVLIGTEEMGPPPVSSNCVRPACRSRCCRPVQSCPRSRPVLKDSAHY